MTNTTVFTLQLVALVLIAAIIGQAVGLAI
jgi:hypothetical protein